MSYPTDQKAVQTMQPLHLPQEVAQQPEQMQQAYQFQQSQAGTQWVDSPVAAPPQPVEQDMVFQWVDTPSYERTAHQQHYLQAQHSVSPYMQGMDSSQRTYNTTSALGPPHGIDPRSPSHLLDPHYNDFAWMSPTRLKMESDEAVAQAQGMDPNYTGLARYGLPGQNLGGLDQGVQYQQRRDMLYGQGMQQMHMDGSYQHYDHSSSRRTATGARPGAGQRGARGQTQGGHRQTTDISGSNQRRGAELNADAQAAAVLEKMGPDALRSTLVTILESLYEDRIKPMANYVKGRLKERATPEAIVKSFVELYSQHPDLFTVQQPDSGSHNDEATIYFVKEPTWFKGWMDIDAPDDPYDESTWDQLAKFLDGEHTFAGGRYGMACELMQRNLPFLAHLSLGEICHMIQLAIQHRKLIVYHRKMLKPIQSVLCQLSPANGNGANAEGEEIKDMDDLCMVLFRMLTHHPQGIRLCRMKQIIKHELCRKLSEMAFQCTKLIELFNREPLSTTFVLDTENDGKSIYVRLGDPDKFTDHIKHIYATANSTDMKQAMQGS